MGSAPVSKTVNNVKKSIIWLDASINNTQEYINAQQLLHTPMNYLKTYIDDKECEKHIRSISKDNQIILIVDDQLGELFVPRIHQLPQISKIFVYCQKKKNQAWTKTYMKIQGVFDEMNELVIQILSTGEKQNNHDRFEQPLSFNIFHTVNNGWKELMIELNSQFVHSQILIDCLLRMKSNSTDINEFTSYCKKIYAKNNSQLKIIHEFQQNYSADYALKWYTRDCFLFKLLNNAFRMQNIDLLYLLAFFIRDLYQQLKHYQYSSPIHLYRSQLMSKKEVRQLKHSIGQLISINSFLSTTPNRKAAFIFSDNTKTSNNDFQPVLFEIKADPHIGNITPFSYIDDKKEVIMMLGSIFRIVHIRYEKHLCIVQLVLCSENNHDIKLIFDHMKNKYHGVGYTNSGIYGIALANIGKLDDAERYLHYSLNEVLATQQTDYIDVYNLSVLYVNLGAVITKKGDYNESLDWFYKALEIRLQVVKANDPSIADIYHAIGFVYNFKGEYKKAITSYNKALMIYRRVFGDDHLKLADIFLNISDVHMKEENYLEALYYEHKTLTIQEKHLPMNHYMLGKSHTNIATTYRYLRKLDLALEHFIKAIQIYEKSFPYKQVDIAIAYSNIGTIYMDKNDFQQALAYMEMAAAIFRQTVSSTHPNAIDIEQKIQNIRSFHHRHK